MKLNIVDMSYYQTTKPITGEYIEGLATIGNLYSVIIFIR
jgi:hypothetical protein